MAVKGSAARVFIDKYNLSTSLNEANSAAEAEELDATVFESSNFRSYVAGFKGGQFTVSGFFSHSTAAGANESDNVFGSFIGTTSTPIVTYAPGGSTVGDNCQMFNAAEVGYEITSAVGDLVGVAASFRDTNGPRIGQVLHAHKAETTTGVTAGVERGAKVNGVTSTAGSTKGGVAHLHITAASTLTSITVTIQHSSNNSVWADLLSFTASTDVTAKRSTVAGTVKRYLRETRKTGNYTGGASKSVTYIVGFSRNL